MEKTCQTCKYCIENKCFCEDLPFLKNPRIYEVSEDGILRDRIKAEMKVNNNEDPELATDIETAVSELYQEEYSHMSYAETDPDFCCKYWK